MHIDKMCLQQNATQMLTQYPAPGGTYQVYMSTQNMPAQNRLQMPWWRKWRVG